MKKDLIESNDKQTRCKYCEKIYSKANIKRHMKKAHKIKESTLKDYTIRRNKNRLECKLCDDGTILTSFTIL